MNRKTMPANCQKAVCSVTEMARLVELSRARFYQLVREGFFPMPLYDLRSRRPYYTQELQGICLQVRTTGIGHTNGLPILFYSPRQKSASAAVSTGKSKEPPSDPVVSELTQALRNLGLQEATTEQVAETLESLYPDRQFLNKERGLLLRELFRHLRGGRSAEHLPGGQSC